MAERTRPSANESTDVAVEDVPTVSATETYTARAAALFDEESRLAALHHRQEGGAQLNREEVLDKLVLEETIAQMREEVESLRKPMLAEVQAMNIADTVETMNDWVVHHQAAFEGLIQAIAALYPAKQRIVDVHNHQAHALNGLPAFRNLGLTLPTGEEVLRNMLNRLPDGAAWTTILMAPHSGPLTKKHVTEMADVYPTAKPQDVRHMTRRVQMQRR